MEEKRKILYVITQSEWGGAQRYILDLATNLPADQFEVAIVAGGSGPLFDKAKIHDIPIIQAKKLRRSISNPIADMQAVGELRRIFEKLQPDIVHLNSTKAGVVGAIAARLAKVPKVLYTAHGFVFNEPLPRWKKTLYKKAERFTARFKQHIICVSEADRQSALANKIASEEKLTTIYNGVPVTPPELTKTEARAALNISPDAICIGTIANFYPTKGLPYLLQAAQLVARQVSNVSFVIIGDGPQRKELEREIKKLQLQDTVILAGHQDRAERFLPAFDLYVLSSVKEGLPYAILEAMAAELPIIATQVGGIPEIIQHKQNGMLVGAKAPVPLSNTIVGLLHNPEMMQQLASAGADRVQQQFNLHEMVAQTLELYY